MSQAANKFAQQMRGRINIMKTVKSPVYLYPGDYCVSGEEIVIATTLGSCVSACLYDPIQRIVGMNHFLLSSRRYSKSLPYYRTEAGKYGIHAMELVINGMLALGARKSNLQCKSFGGASLFRQTPGVDNFLCVGEVNERFIRAFLCEEGIPLVRDDLGGEQGRVIRFYADDFSVYVKKIRSTVNIKLGAMERQYWQSAIERQEKTTPLADLWE
jgi:chemotaxis protein CheD